MIRIKRFLFVVLFILPAVFGFAGYLYSGEALPDAAYMAIKMYFFDADSLNNNILTEISRWIAPLFTVSGVLLIVKNVFSKIVDFFIEFKKDAVAVYGDNEHKKIVIKNIRHAVNGDNDGVEDVENHILMFEKEEDSLAFYNKYKSRFKGEVFIKIDKNDCYSVSLPGVKFFNPYEITARRFWQEYDIRQVIREEEMRIAIVGSDILSRKILTYGLLNNIYSLNQKIRYEIWSDNDFYKASHSDFVTMNGDSVEYRDNNSSDRLREIALADRIIITDCDDYEFIGEIANMTRAEIYLFDPMSAFVNMFANDRIHTFGQYVHMLTEENIRTDNLYSFAKKINHCYAIKYLADGAVPPTEDGAWNELNSFTKGSNIASADYHSIRLIVMEETGKTVADEELSHMEHIRWCRYHYLNHWKYGETVDGRKDAEKRIHPCLVPFENLSDADKLIDTDNIKILLEL